MKSRVCKKCKTEKLLSEFRDNRTQCKVCSNLEGKEWREKNKHNSEYKRKKRESNKKYKEENTEKIKKQTKKYYEENCKIKQNRLQDGVFILEEDCDKMQNRFLHNEEHI